MSVLMVATVSLECKNLFAYSENNPVTGKDSSGGIIESAFDIVTLAGSIVDVCCHPTDPWAWAGLVGDAVDLVPFVTGVGEGIKGIKAIAKVAGKADDVHDAGKAAGNAAETAQVISKSTGKYQVGAYQDVKGVEGLDAHHVGQKAIMQNLVANYDSKTAPAINVPKVGHTISGPNGIVSRSTKGIGNARQLLARDLYELKRVYPDIPNSSYRELIDLSMRMYPEMRK